MSKTSAATRVDSLSVQADVGAYCRVAGNVLGKPLPEDLTTPQAVRQHLFGLDEPAETARRVTRALRQTARNPGERLVLAQLFADTGDDEEFPIEFAAVIGLAEDMIDGQKFLAVLVSIAPTSDFLIALMSEPIPVRRQKMLARAVIRSQRANIDKAKVHADLVLTKP